jgi:hypothetical protein
VNSECLLQIILQILKSNFNIQILPNQPLVYILGVMQHQKSSTQLAHVYSSIRAPKIHCHSFPSLKMFPTLVVHYM